MAKLWRLHGYQFATCIVAIAAAANTQGFMQTGAVGCHCEAVIVWRCGGLNVTAGVCTSMQRVPADVEMAAYESAPCCSECVPSFPVDGARRYSAS